jgi:hypothetical protein
MKNIQLFQPKPVQTLLHQPPGFCGVNDRVSVHGKYFGGHIVVISWYALQRLAEQGFALPITAGRVKKIDSEVECVPDQPKDAVAGGIARLAKPVRPPEPRESIETFNPVLPSLRYSIGFPHLQRYFYSLPYGES